jgi:hypothetical protein
MICLLSNEKQAFPPKRLNTMTHIPNKTLHALVTGSILAGIFTLAQFVTYLIVEARTQAPASTTENHMILIELGLVGFVIGLSLSIISTSRRESQLD